MKKFLTLAVIFSLALLCVGCKADNLVCEQKLMDYIEIDCKQAYMLSGEDKLVHVKIKPKAAGFSLSWSSDNEGVATVTDEGVITAVAAGKAKIEAKIVDTQYKSTCEVIVSDIAVSAQFTDSMQGFGVNKFNSFDSAIAAADKGDTVMVYKGYYKCEGKIDKDISIVGDSGSSVSGLSISDNCNVYIDKLGIYVSDPAVGNGGIKVGMGCILEMQACEIIYDIKDEKGNNVIGNAGEEPEASGESSSSNQESQIKIGTVTGVECNSDFKYIKLDGCKFSGQDIAIKIGASTGFVSIRDNTISSCKVGIDVDVRKEGNENIDMQGLIQGNIISDTQLPTVFRYNGTLYSGTLKFEDYRPSAE